MGKGRIDFCKQCGEEHEMAGAGLCFKCYRRFERVIKGNQDARSDRAHDSETLHLRKAQQKMVGAVYDLHKLLSVFKEYGAASEFLADDSKTIATLEDVLVPLMEKATQTVKPQKLLPDPLDGPLHIQTVMGNDYIMKPFAGALSQPLEEGRQDDEEQEEDQT